MTIRACYAEFVFDIHKTSLADIDELTESRLTNFASEVKNRIIGSHARYYAFVNKFCREPIECDTVDKLPSEAQVKTHMDAILGAFNSVTMLTAGLVAIGDQQANQRAFDVDLAFDPDPARTGHSVDAVGNLTSNSSLSCIHLVWSEELQRWIEVPNRDLAVVTEGGLGGNLNPAHPIDPAVVVPATQKVLSPNGGTQINASIRIILHIGGVIS